MPNVGYNRRTNQYVMVYWSSKYGFQNSAVALAVSSTPFGPFVNVPPLVMQGGKVISSTTGLFIDDDNTAYVRYNTRDAPLRHVIEKLSPDWMTSTGQFSIIVEKQDYPWFEGGGVFKRKGIYYTMLGVDCCFCQWGADARTFTATDVLGNWTYLAQLNYCADGKAPPDHIDGMSINPCSLSDPYGTNFTVAAQQFNVATLPISPEETLYMYYGERFRSSQDGIKGHDFQAWIPIEFMENDTPKPMMFYDNFTINIQEEYGTKLF